MRTAQGTDVGNTGIVLPGLRLGLDPWSNDAKSIMAIMAAQNGVALISPLECLLLWG